MHNEKQNMKENINYIDPSQDISDLLFDDKAKLSFSEDKKRKLAEIDYTLNKSHDEISVSKEQNPEDNSLKPKTKTKKSIKVLYTGILITIFLLGIILGCRVYYAQMSDKNIINTEWGNVALDIPQSEEMVNVLAIGFDEGGYRTDTMMIINFDPKTSNVNLISIPRDTLIGINGKRMKLNAVFAVGKFDTTLKAIRKLTGLPIHYYIAVDTKGFRDIIDILGGVYFDVPKSMKYNDPAQGLKIELSKGYQLLDGNKSEQLVRYRTYAMADLERGEVQKKFIKALIEQKLTLANISDISKMRSMYNNLSSHVKTNVGFNDVMKYFVAGLKIKSDNFKTYTLPGVPMDINGVSYYVYDKTKSIALFKQISGQDVETKMNLTQGIDAHDINSIVQKVQEAKEPSKTTQDIKNSQEGSERDIFERKDITMDDGKDIEYTDVGDIKEIEPRKSPSKQDDMSDISDDKDQDNSINNENTTYESIIR